MGHFLDTKQERHALYTPLNKLLGELKDDTEPYLVYLRGLLHMRLEQRDAAIDCFVSSVAGRPYNWSAWTQLAQLIDSADKVGAFTRSFTRTRLSCPTLGGPISHSCLLLPR